MELKDKIILRELAKRVNEIASLPIMEERRRNWKKHNRLDRVKPLILVFPEGSWREILPDSEIKSEDQIARLYENDLRKRIIQHELINTT